MKKIKTIKSLYRHLDTLYEGVLKFCPKCKDPCCYGYVWLLKKEACRLYKKGVPLVEINNNVNFIHSFPSKNGKILVNQVKPPCILSIKGKCFIYKDRPLNCRFYPIDIRKRGENFYIVFHKECSFIKTPRFLDKAVSLFYNLDKELFRKIIDTFREVDNLSYFPFGKESPSDYLKILEVSTKKGGGIEMSKCKAVLDSKKVKSIKVKSRKK